MNTTRRSFLLGLGGAALAAGCGGGGSVVEPATRSVAMQWNEELLFSLRGGRLGPPMTARAIAIVHTCLYDAWACYDDVANTTQVGVTRRPAAERTRANQERALSYAAFRALSNLFPDDFVRLSQRLESLGYSASDATEQADSPTGVGNHCARLIIEGRAVDGANQAKGYADTTGYVPVNTPDVINDPSQWQPLRFANGKAPSYIAPHWGKVRPFALASGSSLRPSAPPSYGSAEYLRQVQQLLGYYTHLTETHKAIAEYWADGPGSVLPPGHWLLFADWVSQRDGHTLDQDVKLLFLVGNAMMDAGIVAWDAKRAYNTSRPITAIRSFMAGREVVGYAGPDQGLQRMDGRAWMPYQSPNFVTPPFPEYVSGHSAFSAAAAEILKRFTSSDVFGKGVTVPVGALAFESNSPSQPITLSWTTFSEAADQAGISRLYGGIHFESGDLTGRQLGRRIGEAVWNRGMAYITGAV